MGGQELSPLRMVRRGCLAGASGALAFALLSAWATPAAAQRVQSSLVIGGVDVRYADAFDVTALSLNPAVSVRGRRALLAGVGTLSQPLDGGWTGQGLISGSVFTPAAGLVSAEVAGLLGGSTHADGGGTGQLQLVGRAHAAGSRSGAWAGGGVGRVWDGARWRLTRLGELGGWIRLSTVGLSASITPTVVGDSVRYADSQLSLRFRTPRVELDAFLGTRLRTGGPATVAPPAVTWGSLSASLRITRRVALVASGGTYPLDPMQGFPSGRFTLLGIRLTGPGSATAPAIARSAAELGQERTMRSGLAQFGSRGLAGGRHEIRVRAPTAQVVEITGDFTGWMPVRLTAIADGWWILTLPLEPGSYEFMLRLDGAAWLAPPTLPVRRDEFGGASAILTVR